MAKSVINWSNQIQGLHIVGIVDLALGILVPVTVQITPDGESFVLADDVPISRRWRCARSAFIGRVRQIEARFDLTDGMGWVLDCKGQNLAMGWAGAKGEGARPTLLPYR